MRVSLFDFQLPQELIASKPAEPRESARLLHVQGRKLVDWRIGDLPDLLNPGDILVFNDTKVIPARLRGKKGDANIEILLHQPAANPVAGELRWNAFAKPGKKLKPDDTVTFAEDFFCRVIEKRETGEVVIAFDVQDFQLKLERYGEMPLPPYIERPGGATEEDKSNYQTVYAKHEGAVAAPTAGLHFTPALLVKLKEKGIQSAFVTLHVGAGTFQPVKVEDTNQHVMHREWGQVTAQTAEQINAVRTAGGKVVAVGTTSLRLLESAADDTGRLHAYSGDTGIFITPGYRFKIIDCLMTNFHLPKSTLFMLVSAFAGLDEMQAAYMHAIESKYRFYSYGDACLLERR